MVHSDIDWGAVTASSVMPVTRLQVLHEQAQACASLQGAVVELGVHRGGSALLLAQTLPGRMLVAVDSFRGLGDLCDKDRLRQHRRDRGHANGDFAISERSVRDRICGVLQAVGVKVLQGTFSQVKSQLAPMEFSFAHCDADTYASTLEFVEFVVPRLVVGGRLVVDDLDWPATPGVRRALEEYFAGTVRWKPLKTNQALFIKG